MLLLLVLTLACTVQHVLGDNGNNNNFKKNSPSPKSPPIWSPKPATKQPPVSPKPAPSPASPCASLDCPQTIDGCQKKSGCSNSGLQGSVKNNKCVIQLVFGATVEFESGFETSGGSCTVTSAPSCYCAYTKKTLYVLTTTVYAKCGTPDLPDDEDCDQSEWECVGSDGCKCVRDECEFVSGSKRGHCRNHPSWPCESKKDAVCVCKDDRTKSCKRRTPPPPPGDKCHDDHDCLNHDTMNCNVKCENGCCVEAPNGNDNACLSHDCKCTSGKCVCPPKCGNGMIDDGEQCDDGKYNDVAPNTDPTRGCTSECENKYFKCCNYKDKNCKYVQLSKGKKNFAYNCKNAYCDVCTDVPFVLSFEEGLCQATLGNFKCPICGDKIVQAKFGETCDYGAAFSGDSPSQPCTKDCKKKYFACCNPFTLDCTAKESTIECDETECGTCPPTVFYTTKEAACNTISCPSGTDCAGYCGATQTRQCVQKTHVSGICFTGGSSGSCMYNGADGLGSGFCDPLAPCPDDRQFAAPCKCILKDPQCFCKPTAPSPSSLPPIDRLCSICGNSVVEPGEECDEGSANSDSDESAKCSATCKTKYFVCCSKAEFGACLAGTALQPDIYENCIPPVVFQLTEQSCDAVDCKPPPSPTPEPPVPTPGPPAPTPEPPAPTPEPPAPTPEPPAPTPEPPVPTPGPPAPTPEPPAPTPSPPSPTPAPCNNDQTCGIAPGCKDGPFKGLFCEIDSDCDGSECVRLEHACRKDIECTGCKDDTTIHQCAPCIECTHAQREKQNDWKKKRSNSCAPQETSPDVLQCCPERRDEKAGTPRPTEEMKRSVQQQRSGRNHKEDDCDSNTSPQKCRMRLGCMCQHCTDSCDFDIDTKCVAAIDQTLALDQAGIADNPINALDIFTLSLGGQQANLPAVRVAGQVISQELCQALNDSSCHLHTSSSIRAVIELHDGSLSTPQTYKKEKFDIYRIHAAERTVVITIENTTPPPQDGLYATPLVYLVASGNKCCNPEVIWPFILNQITPQKASWEFRVPSVGDYLVVYSVYKWTVIPGTGEPVMPQDFNDVRCNDYEISVDYHAPVCPPELCNLKPCIAPRDCDSGHHCNPFSCNQAIHRCILAEPNDDHHAMFKEGCLATETIKEFNALPSGENLEPVRRRKRGADVDDDKESSWHKQDDKDVCARAPNGEECIVRKHGKCSLGKCHSGSCTESTEPRVEFDCDCKCPSQCRNVPDCEKQCREQHKDDKRHTWTGFCLVCGGDGTCVCRQEPEPDGCCVDTTNSKCATMSRDDAEDDCKGNGLSFSSTACCSNSKCDSFTKVPPCATTTTPAPTSTPTAAPTAASSTRRQTIRLIGSLAAKSTLASIDAVAEIVEPATFDTVLRVLDAAELRRMQLAIDMFGSAEVPTPICSADIETRSITVRAAAHKQSIGGACDRVDIAHKCLDGAAEFAESGYKLIDRTARTLDQATRYAQASETLLALQRACCAMTYYSALSEACGTSKDSLAALGSLSVVRTSGGVGPECVLFDDAHVDRDLNDFVAEQIVVEIRDASSNRLVAINIHVLPLARGGGYKSSYAISLRGASIESVDSGVNAACSERARAIVRETYDAASIAAVLRQRRQFPEGTRVNVVHHVEHSGDDSAELPQGVRRSTCTALGGSLDDARCRRTDRGDIALFDDVRSALPPVQGDAIDQLLAQGIQIDQSTNTYHRSPTIRARYTASAVLLLPRSSTATDGVSASSVRFVLRNHDCGAAVILLTPSEQRANGDAEPLAISVPPHSCAALRWANEGEQMVTAADDSVSRVCHGGVEGGIVQCTNDHDMECTSAGGMCAQPPAIRGVPFRNAKRHFQCKTCYTESDCSNEPTCANHECCAEELLHWYRYPTAELVYAGHELNIAEAILTATTTTPSASEQKKK